MGLVCLGSAMVAVTAQHIPALVQHPDALSRVVQGTIQGVMAGIGFLGAGALIKGTQHTVYGMTTAAAIWVAAALSIAAGLASWTVFGVGAGLTMLLLVVLHPVEEWLEKRAQKRLPPPDQDNGQP